jgi:glycosyltransferase involved in cell wall biosynthesis
MRIAYVTAHLPPDFTSGATLLVDRLAREAAGRGHQVEVFAGAIHQGLADGEVRVDHPTGERRFAVRWIGTATRIDQDIDGNWDNPLAAAAAAEWLREFRPEVVHMHTLQTLGIGVVDAAVETSSLSGARTIVTMHDLWWWCPRLFLVDTQLRPCPLVTDIGTCACARSASWRRERAERLGRALDGVDRILAPSSALRDVIVANGVDPDRVMVDVNHVADVVAASVADSVHDSVAGSVDDAVHGSVPGSDTETPLRLLYLGGNSPLKGADVVRAAVRQLAADPMVGVDDWRLTAYGLEPDPAVPMPAGVQLLAPFDATEVVDVMAAHDVLILPSVARESFSIAAREALAAGLAVITSDCLGPEEVVVDGLNGLVVPTGNADALAGAVRSLVSDPTMLARLRAGAANAPVSLRTAADHLTSLLEIYADASAVRSTRNDRTVGFVIGVDGESARFRVHHPREALALAGAAPGPVAHHLEPGLDQTMLGCDVVVVQQAPATRSLLAQIESWRAAGVLVVFDLADAGADLESLALQTCDAVFASTAAIAEQVAGTTGMHPVVVADAAGLVDLQLAELARATTSDARSSGRVRVGYVSEAVSDQADVDLITPLLAEVLTRHHHVDVVVVGPFELAADLARFGARVQRLDRPAWRTMAELMKGFDVNLAPGSQERSGGDRSFRSWLNAAMVEVPTVASSSGAASDVIEHGRTGMLYASLVERAAALDELVADDVLRARLGAAARRDLELHHSPHVSARRYHDAFDAFEHRRPSGERHASLMSAAVAEQPRSVVPIASYDLGDAIIGDAVIEGDGRRRSGSAVVGFAERVTSGRVVAEVRQRVGRTLRRVMRL